MTDDRLHLIDVLRNADDQLDALRRACADWSTADADALAALLEEMCRGVQEGALPRETVGWTVVGGTLLDWARQTLRRAPEDALSPPLRQAVAGLYEVLGPAHAARHLLLNMLAHFAQPPELQLLVEILQADPPRGPAAASAPLLHLSRSPQRVPELFPRILACLSNPDLAPTVLDLANFVTRQGHVPVHPAGERFRELIDLLANLTTRLESLQAAIVEGTVPQGDQAATKVDAAVSLTISLCDALALIGNPAATDPLGRVLALRHRRLRVEAAAALARLEDPLGCETLCEMASEPVMRLRVVHYAEELGLTASLPEEYCSPLALAEAELVTHLAEPTELGLPPSTCEMIDSRTLQWPGYEEPRMCYLFRFTYHTPGGSGVASYQNVGIAGPLVLACPPAVGRLPVETIYDFFAGWQAEHAEIQEFALDTQPAHLQDKLPALVAQLQRDGYHEITPCLWGRFFGEDVLTATAETAKEKGIAVADGREIRWYPHPDSPPSLDPSEAYLHL